MSTLGRTWVAHQPQGNSRTKVLGVGFAEIVLGRRKVPHFVATCGRRTRAFNIRRLGRDEAFRRALKVRAVYETDVAERRAA
jgi:hypothetical protein